MKEQIPPLLNLLTGLPEYNRLKEILSGPKAGPVAVFGLPEAHTAHVFAALAREKGGLLLAENEQAALRLHALSSALNNDILFLPPRELPLVNAYAASSECSKTRISVLARLSMHEPVGVIASAETILQHLAPPTLLQNAAHTVRLGDILQPRGFFSALCSAGYEPVELVEGVGQASLRGDILDIYPPHLNGPIRLEFFDDEVDRICYFDPTTQRSLDKTEAALIPPATEAPQPKEAIARALSAIGEAKGFSAQQDAFMENRACPGAEALLPVLYEKLYTLFDYIHADAPVLVHEPHRVAETAESADRLFMQSVAAMLERGEGLPQQIDLCIHTDELIKKFQAPKTALLSALNRGFPAVHCKETLQFEARSAPRFTGDMRELSRDMKGMLKSGDAFLLYAGTHATRLEQQLIDEGITAGRAKSLKRMPHAGEVLVLDDELPAGFYYPPLHLAVLSELELFGYAHKERKKRHSDKPRLLFSELKPGDFIVHEAHGVGRFVGVETLVVQETTRDYLLMEYQGGDKLFIPTDQLDRVQKYIGGEELPRLSKLGGSEWQKQVSRARGAVKELAFDLAKLYAERQNSKGFAFSPDSPWQKQLEERFPYRETPDQIESINDVKKDMESSHVMDRLLCGDVGYGKTEVALRAAFKAVQDSKQVALLVPTTILAQQHYYTFKERFAGFPVRVALLSRFCTALEQKQTKAALTEGTVDVVIGTHALLGKDVKFKDLGLLIIDEEQRFGVGHKELIKTLKANVDVLTLSATPIPRTLHMSMIGIRDMSVIDTPPEDRFPVQTYVLEYSDALLKDALQKELNRGGQCYVVYNQVKQMELFYGHLRTLLKDASIAIAHGQMPEAQLEKVMLDFLEGRYDILICSTIIESGLDISNVNTLFVLQADHMGLSQLYQLRGRVGRSARLGYAYFTFERNTSLTEIAHKRLTTLTEFTQFGAGREIALRDLEIRGAGNLLGAMQHGHIADIGYEYYCKLMNTAVKEAQGEKTAQLFIDTVINIPLDAHIPKSYIKNEVQRLSMYKRIAMIRDGADLLDVQEELFDRYGDIPPATQNLVDISLLKALCAAAQALTLSIGEGVARLAFHPEATLDGGKLLLVAQEFGLQLNQGEQITAVYKKAGADVDAMLQAVFPLMKALNGCL